MEIKISQRLLVWARIAAVAGIAFIAMFSLDAFGGEQPFPEQLIGWLIHMIPAFVLSLVLWMSWNHAVTGASAFLVMSVMPFWMLPANDLIANLILAVPFAICGGLFLASALKAASEKR